jgi:hypothetical protein
VNDVFGRERRYLRIGTSEEGSEFFDEIFPLLLGLAVNRLYMMECQNAKRS